MYMCKGREHSWNRDVDSTYISTVYAASQLVHSSINQAQSLLTRFHRQSDSSNTTRVYIHELLNPRGMPSMLYTLHVYIHVKF